MRIGLAKPDWGIAGGFEVLIDRVVGHLNDSGHEVRELSVPGTAPDRRVAGVRVSDDEWAAMPMAWAYRSLATRFAELDTTGLDLVITTQPGSWAVEHPRKLALFYHHHRLAYDLESLAVDRLALDAEQHTAEADAIRALDAELSPTISHYLVPSQAVARRLTRFWDVSPSSMTEFLAGPISAVAQPTSVTSTRPGSTILCVSRSEFPKRTELFVAAAHEDFGAPAHLVGSGGQLGAVRRWAAERAAGLTVHPRPWERTPVHERVEVVVPAEPVTIHGRLDDDALGDLYSRARVLVAPAFDEDYGLTVLEGFTHGVPAIVCDDGGGLTEFVSDGVNGLIVAPEPGAIAAAVRSIVDDDALAGRLRAGALSSAAEFTWQRAHEQLDAAITRTVEAVTP